MTATRMLLAAATVLLLTADTNGVPRRHTAPPPAAAPTPSRRTGVSQNHVYPVAPLRLALRAAQPQAPGRVCAGY